MILFRLFRYLFIFKTLLLQRHCLTPTWNCVINTKVIFNKDDEELAACLVLYITLDINNFDMVQALYFIRDYIDKKILDEVVLHFRV